MTTISDQSEKCLLEIDEEKKKKKRKVERGGMSKQPIRPVFQGSRRRGENRPGELLVLTTPPQLDNNSYIIIIEHSLKILRIEDISSLCPDSCGEVVLF